MLKIAPSILSADFKNLEYEVKKVIDEDVDYIHVDIMDGNFVPNISFGGIILDAIKDVADGKIDVHMMVENPDNYIREYADKGANIITVHQEATKHLHRTIQLIKECGVKAGVALNPATPIESIEDILVDLDLVLIMTVNPGFGGQKFIPQMKDKIKRIKAKILEKNPNIILQVDGGVSLENKDELKELGVDLLVAGSAIYNSDDYRETIRKFKND